MCVCGRKIGVYMIILLSISDITSGLSQKLLCSVNVYLDHSICFNFIVSLPPPLLWLLKQVSRSLVILPGILYLFFYIQDPSCGVIINKKVYLSLKFVGICGIYSLRGLYKWIK